MAVRHGEREERGSKGDEDNAADDFCASYAGFFHGGLLFFGTNTIPEAASRENTHFFLT